MTAGTLFDNGLVATDLVLARRWGALCQLGLLGPCGFPRSARVGSGGAALKARMADSGWETDTVGIPLDPKRRYDVTSRDI